MRSSNQEIDVVCRKQIILGLLSNDYPIIHLEFGCWLCEVLSNVNQNILLIRYYVPFDLLLAPRMANWVYLLQRSIHEPFIQNSINTEQDNERSVSFKKNIRLFVDALIILKTKGTLTWLRFQCKFMYNKKFTAVCLVEMKCRTARELFSLRFLFEDQMFVKDCFSLLLRTNISNCV